MTIDKARVGRSDLWPSEQFVVAMNEFGRRFGEALACDLERIARAAKPLLEASRKAYREAGAPYGDTDDGMMRWFGDLRAEANARWEREKQESIRETCEMLRSRRGW